MTKPQPRVTEVNKPFWDAANEGRLLLQRCVHPGCGRFVFYPRVCCPYCKHDGLQWTEVGVNGRVISHTTVHRVHHDSFTGEAPYVFAAVELDAGPLMYGQLADAPVDGSSLIGRAVVAEFVAHGPQRRIVAFRLVGA